MLLANLLRTLSSEEIETIRKDFRLPERSRLVFERIAGSASSPPDSESLAKAFRISKENLYRLFSEIVDECVRILAPKEEFATLKFYQRRYLYRPFITELQRTEKQLIRENHREVLEKFYRYAFMESTSFPVSNIDLDLSEELGRKWHRAKLNPPPDDDLYIKLRMIYMRIGALPSKKKMTFSQQQSAAHALLEPVRKRARTSPNPLARCFYYQAEWKAGIYDKNDVQTINFLQSSLETVRNNRGWFGPNWEETIELQIASELANTTEKASESLEIYRKHYHGQTSETSPGAIFLCRFMEIAFLARDFKTAWEILGRFESNPAIRVMPMIHMMGLLTRIKLQLAERDLDTAQASIDEAREAHKESFFLAYDLPLRALETVLDLKANNLKEADKRVQRNIKWLHSRRISLSASAWIHFYNVIGAIIRNRMSGEPIRSSLLYHFQKEFRAESPVFYALLEDELRI